MIVPSARRRISSAIATRDVCGGGERGTEGALTSAPRRSNSMTKLVRPSSAATYRGVLCGVFRRKACEPNGGHARLRSTLREEQGCSSAYPLDHSQRTTLYGKKVSTTKPKLTKQARTGRCLFTSWQV